MKEKYIIGLTGGIGSGKTLVLELLKTHYNAMIIEADKVGHELQMPGETAYNCIIKQFGTAVLEEPCLMGSSPINRKKLGDMVFSDETKLKLLNDIMHPAIHNRIECMIKSSDSKVIVLEAAILTETSLIHLVNELWYIYAEKNIRLERLQNGRNISKEKALLVMSNQPDDDYFRKKSDIIIDNSLSEEYTLNQINKVMKNSKS